MAKGLLALGSRGCRPGRKHAPVAVLQARSCDAAAAQRGGSAAEVFEKPARGPFRPCLPRARAVRRRAPHSARLRSPRRATAGCARRAALSSRCSLATRLPRSAEFRNAMVRDAVPLLRRVRAATPLRRVRARCVRQMRATAACTRLAPARASASSALTTTLAVRAQAHEALPAAVIGALMREMKELSERPPDGIRVRACACGSTRGHSRQVSKCRRCCCAAAAPPRAAPPRDGCEHRCRARGGTHCHAPAAAAAAGRCPCTVRLSVARAAPPPPARRCR